MKVREIMTGGPAWCTPDTSLKDVARKMVDNDCGALPVVKAGDHGEVIGVITDRDVVVRAVAEGKDARALTAEACMTASPVTVRDESTVEDCVDLMESRKIRRVPVVGEDGRLRGMVSQADIARHGSSKDTGELVRDVSAPGRA